MKHETDSFHKNLKSKMDLYAHAVYAATRKFPREELYGTISQLRRAAISVILNYVEGYARGKSKVHRNFLEISYGSLKESKYLLEFSLQEKFLSAADCNRCLRLADEIGAMLWGVMRNLKD